VDAADCAAEGSGFVARAALLDDSDKMPFDFSFKVLTESDVDFFTRLKNQIVDAVSSRMKNTRKS
jgi:hypothetical protein